MPTYEIISKKTGNAIQIESQSQLSDSDIDHIASTEDDEVPVETRQPSSTQDEFNQFRENAIAEGSRGVGKRAFDLAVKQPVNLIKSLAKTGIEGVQGVGEIYGEGSTHGASSQGVIGGNLLQSVLEGGGRVVSDLSTLAENKAEELARNPKLIIPFINKYLNPLDIYGKAIDLKNQLTPRQPSEEEINQMFERFKADQAYQKAREQGVVPEIVGKANTKVANAVPLALAIPDAAAIVSKIPAMASRIPNTLKASALNDVKQALLAGGGTKTEKAIASKIAPEILDRPMSDTFRLTRKGMEEKAVAGKEAAGEAIEAFGELKGSASTKDVIDALENYKNENFMVAGKPSNPVGVERVQAVQDIIAQYGDSISKETMRELYRKWGKEVKSQNWLRGDFDADANLAIKKEAVNEMRKIITADNPDLVKLNKQFSFFARLTDVISGTNTRLAGKSGGLTPFIAGTAGGVASGGSLPSMALKGYAIKKAFQAMRSPGWKLTSARAKNALAEALGASDIEATASALSLVPGFEGTTAAAISEVAKDEAESSKESPQITIPPR